ncbi:response regulator [Rasiella rasia]|uniref:histidine kinase n=1 Tax=Rasiella rasia TaxID=2744027 RepID=A0A6G6GP21_9FLAO|nr:response regulator [Rasiella rasia]QIE60298.1 response regulator [Rasiella rasia]
MKHLVIITICFLSLCFTKVCAQISVDSVKTTFKNYSKDNPKATTNNIKAYWHALPISIKKDSSIAAHRDYAIGMNFYYQRNPDSSYYYFNRAGKNLIFKEDPFLVNEALILKAMIKNIYGESEVVQKTLDSASANFNTVDSVPYTLRVNLNRAYGAFYTTNNEQEKAIDHLIKALELTETGEPNPRAEASIKQNLGELFLNLNDIPKARSYFLLVQEEALANDIPRYYHSATLKLADLIESKDEISEKTVNDLNEAMAFFKDLGDKGRIVEAHNYLGQIYKLTGNNDIAMSNFKQGLILSEEMQFPSGIINLAKNLGLMNLSLNRLEEAEQNFETARKFVYSHGNVESQIEIEQALAETLEKQGKLSQAYPFLKAAIKKTDSLNKAKTTATVQELETAYQTKEKEQQIALLTSENELAEQQKRNQRNILWAVLSIVGIVGVFLFFYYRNRQRVHQKLKELDAAKSSFFANISHEFRTPLTLVKGPISEQLEKDQLTPTERKKMQIAHKNVGRVQNLVEEMLALSKLESGHYQLHVAEGYISTFMKAQAQAFEFLAEEKKIHWEVNIPETKNQYWFDRDAVEKITTNLFSNAIKYTPANEKVRIIGSHTNHTYTLDIINTGVKLSAKDRKNIFERFYQNHPDNPGSGIGLALSRELSQLHKGTLELIHSENEENHFRLTLGVAKELFTTAELATKRTEIEHANVVIAHQPSDTENLLQPSTKEDVPQLLLIDDNKDVLNYITLLFQDSYNVRTANNGEEGYKSALEHIPDLIISDVMMPFLDGYELTKKLKEEELTAHIPLILVTAKTEDEDKLTGSKLGADAYVTKPFNSTLLQATVQNLLENRKRLQNRYSKTIILSPKEISVSTAEEKFLERMQKALDKNIQEPTFTPETFSKEIGVSRMQLHRKLKALTGLTTTEFIMNQRVKLAASLLKKRSISVSEVAYEVGFNNPSYFSKCFKDVYGISPSNVKKSSETL